MFLSVIIPTCNRNELLALCLERLAPGRQTGMELVWPGADGEAVSDPPSQSARSPSPAGYEVIVTDDGGRASAETLIRQHYPWARWVAGPRRGPAANRNQGAKAGRGDWLAFVDDDCLPSARWLAAVMGAVTDTACDVVEGKTVMPDKTDNPFRQGVENLHGNCFWSCNLAVKREVFERMGGFDEDFEEAGGEDMEFAFRLKQTGRRTRFVEAALVEHPTRVITWRGLFCRLRMIRWMALFYLKTGAAPALGASALRAALWLAANRTMEFFHTTWHCFRDFEPASWRTRLFWQAWKLLTLPVTMYFLVVWDWRFRQQLAARRTPASSCPSELHPS